MHPVLQVMFVMISVLVLVVEDVAIIKLAFVFNHAGTESN
jgi:hypothetical protein